MTNVSRYTFLVFTVAVMIALTGIAVLVLLPGRLDARQYRILEDRARTLASVAAEQAAPHVAAADSAALTAALEVISGDREVVFAAVVDPAGAILARYGRALTGVGRWATPDPDRFPAAVASRPIDGAGVLTGYVHVGMSLEESKRQAQAEHRMVYVLGIFLLALATGAAFGVFQLQKLRSVVEEWQKRHQSLRMQTGTLQSSVKEHKQTEQALRQSEEKYRSLFQNAMSSAMRDLEDLNKHLEKRSADLEVEVGVREKAEAALRRYTERLQIMNEVERTMLEGRSLGTSVDIALRRMTELLGQSHLALFEIDHETRTPLLLGHIGETPHDAWLTVSAAELELLADGTKAIRYEADVESSDSPSSMTSRFIRSGLRSYFYVPLVMEESTVGLLLVASPEPGAFGDESFDISRDMADLMTIGIQQSRLSRERERYENELITARDRAEEMARLKSAFLTNMSHEIRTPIAGIMGFAQVLNDEAPENLREFTGLIQEAANRLLNTINSVLELARLESGRLTLEAKPIDMGPCVVETARLIEPLAVRKGIRLLTEVPSEPVIARLDRASLERIVNNLVGNAIKFTDRGHVKVSVTGDERNARLEVTDTGVGIAADFLPNLFDEFRQEQMDANREHEGSGLGLAITKKLVDRMGGFIDVESEKGKGTKFIVQFPMRLATSEQTGDSRGHALVVAPHADSAALLTRNIESRWHVTEVPSLASVMPHLEERTVDAVVIDINAVESTEYSDVSALRSRLPDARLVAVATQVLPDDVAMLTDLGIDCFVSDPFEGDNLLKALSNGHAPDREAMASGHRRRRVTLHGPAVERRWTVAGV